MSGRRRVLVLILIMAVGSALTTGIAVRVLYLAAFEQESDRLVEMAKSQARLIEAVARFDVIHNATFEGGAFEATLAQVVDAHSRYQNLGKTGEFTLARRESGEIVFLLRHRHSVGEAPSAVPFNSGLAEPMRRALSGLSGTVVGLDYRGETVLAAHEPVGELDLGIVAKIDLAEVQAPFKVAGVTAGLVALVVVLAGAALFRRITEPLIERLEEHSENLERVVSALRESEERFRGTFEQAAMGIAHVAPDGGFRRVNRKYCEIAGYSAAELRKLGFADITHPDDLALDLENVERMLAGELDEHVAEKRYIRPDGTAVWVNLTAALVRTEIGDPKYFIAVAEDISERRRTAEALEASLREKDVLLREIHHRVKNNMQVISSLLSLQSGQIEDESLRRVFEESQSRVRAMALVHENLHESEGLSRISLGLYLERVVRALLQMYDAGEDRVRLRVDVDDVALGVDDTVPCGLVINELLSNSLKHAFPDGRSGEIRIQAAATEDGDLILSVADDGVGVPEDVDLDRGAGMGMQLVTALVEGQLGGELCLTRDGGTVITIRFPLVR